MEEEKVIQVSVQLPAQALQGFTDMVRQLRQLAAELRGGPRAGAEAMENAAFDEERFLTMLVDAAGSDVPFAGLASLLEEAGRERDLSIRAQREDIFNAMHRI